MERLRSSVAEIWARWEKSKERLKDLSEQEPWWPRFMEEVRAWRQAGS